MRLVACQNCHTQFDVTNVAEASFRCRCGETIENRPLEGQDVRVRRCGSCGAIVRGEAKHCAYCRSEIVRDGAELSLVCPECYARNAEDSRFCTGCGVAFQPETVQVEGYELPCPCCGCLMPPRQVGGIGINECPQCNGIWAPEQRLDLLVQRAIEARKQADPTRFERPAPRVSGSNPVKQCVQYRKCPRCDAFMQRRNFRRSSGVIVDRCREHGAWLDADELEQIAGYILSGGRPEAERHMAESDAHAAEALARARVQAIAARHRAGWSTGARGFGSHRERGGFATFVRILDDLFG